MRSVVGVCKGPAKVVLVLLVVRVFLVVANWPKSKVPTFLKMKVYRYICFHHEKPLKSMEPLHYIKSYL